MSEVEKIRPTTTRTRECEITNIILQDTTKGAWLKLEPVRVAHERILDVPDNDSIRLINTREAHRLRAMPRTVARLCLTSLPALLLQRSLRLSSHAARLFD